MGNWDQNAGVWVAVSAKSEEGSNTVALQNGLALVRLLSDEGPMTLDELAQRAALRPDMAAKLIKMLELHGYVEPARFAGRFQPGRVAGALSEAFLRGAPISEVARPVMQALAERHDAAVSLMVPDADHALSLLVCRSVGRNTPTEHAGSTAPMVDTAAGHALLFTARAHGEELALPPEREAEKARLTRSLKDSIAFFRASGCFKVVDEERSVLLLGAPLHLSNAVLALEAVVRQAARQDQPPIGLVGDLLTAIELIQQKSAAAGVRYLDD